jgi:protein SCO1/2
VAKLYKSNPIRLILLLAIFMSLGAAAARPGAQGKTDSVGYSESDDSAANFSLIDQSGRPFQLAQLRGKIVLLFFGYTSCPDACPTTLSKISRVYKMLGPRGDRVVTLFISLDPGRDTPQVLKEYLKYFKLNSVGLTGTKEEIDLVVNKYGAKYEIEKSDSAAGYHINHSTDLYLLDQKGEVSRRFAYADGTQLIVEHIRRLLG